MTSAPLDILLFTNSHLPQIGGKEIVVHHLASQYQKLGHQVRVAGPAGYRRHKGIELGYPVDRSPSYFWLGRESQWRHRTNRILKKRTYDVIHAHATHPCGYYAQKYLLKKNLSTPLVVTPHGADIHKVPEVNFGRRLDPALDEKIRWLVSRCDQSTAISESVRDSLIDAQTPAEKISMIPNGVDTDRFSTPVSFSAHEKLGINETTPLFVSTGNYHPRKGHEHLIDAVAELKGIDLHLAIVGRTNDDCVARAQEKGVADKITFTGALAFPIPGMPQSDDLLVAMLQQARAYVSASMGEGTEGLSLALLEAMAAGACPLGTSISGNRDIIEDGQNGLLVPPASATHLADKLRALCEQPNLSETLGQAACDSIKHMSWALIAQQYIAMYYSLIEARS